MKAHIHLTGKESIHPDSVLYMRADINYTEVLLENGQKIVISKTLKEMERRVKSFPFFRTHKSYLVNMNRIESFNLNNGSCIRLSNTHSIEISRRRKDAFLQAYRSFKN